MRIGLIALGAVLTFLCSDLASASLPAIGDEFGEFRQIYQPRPACHPKPTAVCTGENASLCALSSKTSLFPTQDSQRAFLMELGWVLHKRGLSAAANEVRDKLTALGGPIWSTHDTPYSWIGQSQVSLQESGEKWAESNCTTTLHVAENPPDGAEAFAKAVYLLAVEGKAEDTKRLLDQVKTVPDAVALNNLPMSPRIRFLAMAWAEIGDYTTAEKFVVHDQGRLRGLITQVALNHGDLDDATHLAGHEQVGRMDADQSLKLARLGIIQRLLETGQTSRAKSLVSDWTFINLDRLVALNEAARDPVAAYDTLSESEQSACRYSIVSIGAQHGKAESALAVLLKGTGSTLLDSQASNDNFARHPALYAALKVARAYADSGEEEKARILLDRLNDDFWSSPPSIPLYDRNTHWSGVWEIPYLITSAYGEIGYPDISGNRMNSIWKEMPPTSFTKADIMGWMATNAAHSLVERNRLDKALDLADRQGDQQATWYAAIVHALAEVPGKIRPVYDPLSFLCSVEISN